MNGVTTLIPNRFQEAIFDFISDESKGNLMVKALAGTGKTVTNVMSLNVVPEGKTVVFLAYNKHIAKELREKAPRSAEVRTTHSMGFEAVRNYNEEQQTEGGNEYKIYNIIDDVRNARNDEYAEKNNKYEIINDGVFKQIKLSLVHTVNHFRNSLLPVTEENLDYILDKYDISIPYISLEAKLEIINKALENDRADTLNIDFTDMLYLPTTMMMTFRKYDFVFVDEAQDLNESQLRMLLMLRKPNTGRIIAFGDKNQSIYQFRGADTEAMDKIQLATDAETLPLNICYRCPSSHIKLANEFVPEMEPAPNAIEGFVKEISLEEIPDYIQPGDLAICRNNAPLVRPAIDLLKAGFKVNIRGKDIKKSLVDLIKKTDANNLEKMRVMLTEHVRSETRIMEAKGKNPSALIDKVEVIFEFSNYVKTPKELVNYIYKLFRDEKTEVTFSTIHGAKGLEADNIFFIKPSLIPSPYAKQDWELQSENNIFYVALTRSKNGLYLIEEE